MLFIITAELSCVYYSWNIQSHLKLALKILDITQTMQPSFIVIAGLIHACLHHSIPLVNLGNYGILLGLSGIDAELLQVQLLLFCDPCLMWLRLFF